MPLRKTWKHDPFIFHIFVPFFFGIPMRLTHHTWADCLVPRHPAKLASQEGQRFKLEVLGKIYCAQCTKEISNDPLATIK